MSETSARTCPNTATCSLFPRLGLRASLGVWTAFYCESKYEECARYKAARAGKPIPDLMLPNGKILRIGGERT